MKKSPKARAALCVAFCKGVPDWALEHLIKSRMRLRKIVTPSRPRRIVWADGERYTERWVSITSMLVPTQRTYPKKGGR